jgi:hypothetical protein
MNANVVAVDLGALVVIGWIVWYFWMSKPAD